MKCQFSLKKPLLIIVITLIPISVYFVSLTLFIVLFNQNYRTDELLRQINSASKFATLNQDISLERAFNLLPNDSSFGIFTTDCKPFLLKDLSLEKSKCTRKDPAYNWVETKINNKVFLLANKREIYVIKFIKDNLFILQITTISFFVFAVTLGLIAFKVFVTTPSRFIANEVNFFLENKGTSENYLRNYDSLIFGDLFKSISSLIAKISSYKYNETRLELSKQIVHDLRAPISLLKDQVGINSNNLDISILQAGIKRIQQISDELFSDSKFNDPIHLDTLLKEISFLENIYRLSIRIISDFDLNFKIRSKINEKDLYRFLTNIIKNSSEANAKEVRLFFKIDNNFLIVNAIDDGDGTTQEALSHLEKGSYTTKTSGSGIGLTSIKKILKESGGNCVIHNSTTGFHIELFLPLILNLNNIKRIVLIDDDKYVAFNWKNKSNLNNIDFLYFQNAEALHSEFNNLNADDHFFIDLNINGYDGLEIAKKIHNKGFKNIFLASGEDTNQDLLPFYIIDNVGKQFPF